MLAQQRAVPESPATAPSLPWTLTTGAMSPSGSSSDDAAGSGPPNALTSPKSSEELALFEHGRQRRKSYRCLGTIGSGTQGTVKEATYIASGRRVALKVLRKNTNSNTLSRRRNSLDNVWEEHEAQIRDMRRKFNALYELRHANLLKVVEFWETDEKFYLATEICEGDVQKYLDLSGGALGENQARVLLEGVLRGIEFLHSRGVVHRDLKPQNILLRSFHDLSSVVLCDFSGAHIPKAPPSDILHSELAVKMMQTVIGTPYYLAPCIVAGNAYTRGVDMWSLGCIAFQLIFGRTPFHHSTSFMQLYQNITEGRWSFPDASTGSDLFRDLVTKLLALDCDDRPSASDALGHPFFSKRLSGAFVSFSTETGVLHWDPMQKMELAEDSMQGEQQERLRMLLA